MRIKADMQYVASGSLMYVGDVRIGDDIIIHQVKVIDRGEDGLTVSLPRRRKADGTYHPVINADKKLMEQIEEAVFQSISSTRNLYEETIPYEVQVEPYKRGKVLADIILIHKETGIKLAGMHLVLNSSGKPAVVYPYTDSPGGKTRLYDLPWGIKAFVERKIQKEYRNMCPGEEKERKIKNGR